MRKPVSERKRLNRVLATKPLLQNHLEAANFEATELETVKIWTGLETGQRPAQLAHKPGLIKV